MSFLEKVKLINKLNERLKNHDVNSVNYELIENSIALIFENLERGQK